MHHSFGMFEVWIPVVVSFLCGENLGLERRNQSAWASQRCSLLTLCCQGVEGKLGGQISICMLSDARVRVSELGRRLSGKVVTVQT